MFGLSVNFEDKMRFGSKHSDPVKKKFDYPMYAFVIIDIFRYFRKTIDLTPSTESLSHRDGREQRSGRLFGATKTSVEKRLVRFNSF